VSGRTNARVLIVLHEPGYFRLYGSMIIELGRRGVDVLLAFDKPDKRGAPQVPAGAGPRVRSIGALPSVDDTRLAPWRAIVDYVRYLDTPFRDAGYLRRRSEKWLPEGAQWLTRMSSLPRAVVGAAIGGMRLLERMVPPDPRMTTFVQDAAPDLVFVSPLVTLGPSGYRHADVIKAAQRLRLPVAVGVASWDHLTSKGLVRVVPDVLTVWNDAQADEAVNLHRVPRSHVAVTGAQTFDHWFEPPQPGAVDRFRARLGLRPGRRTILFAGSSRNMAPGDSEVRFVARWLEALRASDDPAIRDADVIVRPHPTNTEPWGGDAGVPGVTTEPVGPGAASAPGGPGASGGPRVIVHQPSYSGIPLSAEEVETFRLSMLASDAVVGINTTAMIEAAVLGRPVLTIRDEAFVHSQAETLHFSHLPLDHGGCARVADTLDVHVRQLAEVVADPRPLVDAGRAFVARFVRPLGPDVAATDRLCDVLERAARVHVAQPERAVVVADGQAVAGRRGRG
jgi:hypothetical protein